jgi:hypothetical protein
MLVLEHDKTHDHILTEDFGLDVLHSYPTPAHRRVKQAAALNPPKDQVWIIEGGPLYDTTDANIAAAAMSRKDGWQFPQLREGEQY